MKKIKRICENCKYIKNKKFYINKDYVVCVYNTIDEKRSKKDTCSNFNIKE